MSCPLPLLWCGGCLQGNYKSLKALIQLSQLSDLTMKDNDGRYVFGEGEEGEGELGTVTLCGLCV